MPVPTALSLHIPNYSFPDASSDQALKRIAPTAAATTETSGFSSVSVMDHLHQIGPLGPLGALQADCEKVGRGCSQASTDPASVALAGQTLSWVLAPIAVAA